MVEDQKISGDNKAEKKIQKKSQKDMNGLIGGLVFGFLFAFVTYQIYKNFIGVLIGQILVYAVGAIAFVCLWYL